MHALPEINISYVFAEHRIAVLDLTDETRSELVMCPVTGVHRNANILMHIHFCGPFALSKHTSLRFRAAVWSKHSILSDSQLRLSGSQALGTPMDTIGSEPTCLAEGDCHYLCRFHTLALEWQAGLLPCMPRCELSGQLPFCQW
jgi:hypothetical protein